MCILTLFKQKNKIIFTFNRDEQLNRPSEFPKWINNSVFCPTDSLKGGTWIGFNQKSLICLQNGGIEAHVRKSNYTLSRGLMLLNLLKDEQFDINESFKNQTVEPFTITKLNLENQILTTYLFDGDKLYMNEIPFNFDYVNCSSTLYNSIAKQKIKDYFKLKSSSTFNETDVFNWHKEMMIGSDLNQFTNKVNTVSICQFIMTPNSNECFYLDVNKNKLEAFKL